MVQLSAEVRLWWCAAEIEAVEAWFTGLSALRPGGVGHDGLSCSSARLDRYLSDRDQSEVGIKVRRHGSPSARLEIKSLIDVRGCVPWLGAVSLWTKVSSQLPLGEGSVVDVIKLRRLRKFSMNEGQLEELALLENEEPASGLLPVAGCNVEFTRVMVQNSESVWWTLGYESFGTLDEVERILRACVARTTSGRPIPHADLARSATYPEWLRGQGPALPV